MLLLQSKSCPEWLQISQPIVNGPHSTKYATPPYDSAHNYIYLFLWQWFQFCEFRLWYPHFLAERNNYILFITNITIVVTNDFGQTFQSLFISLV